MNPTNDCYRQRAREQYAFGSDDNIEIDDAAKISATGVGAWVAAWVWVRDSEG